MYNKKNAALIICNGTCAFTKLVEVKCYQNSETIIVLITLYNDGPKNKQNMKTRNKKEIQERKQIQSTLVISKSKGPSETLRDIRTSTYQNCRIEEYTNGTTIFHK